MLAVDLNLSAPVQPGGENGLYSFSQYGKTWIKNSLPLWVGRRPQRSQREHEHESQVVHSTLKGEQAGSPILCSFGVDVWMFEADPLRNKP